MCITNVQITIFLSHFNNNQKSSYIILISWIFEKSNGIYYSLMYSIRFQKFVDGIDVSAIEVANIDTTIAQPVN